MSIARSWQRGVVLIFAMALVVLGLVVPNSLPSAFAAEGNSAESNLPQISGFKEISIREGGDGRRVQVADLEGQSATKPNGGYAELFKVRIKNQWGNYEWSRGYCLNADLAGPSGKNGFVTPGPSQTSSQAFASYGIKNPHQVHWLLENGSAGGDSSNYRNRKLLTQAGVYGNFSQKELLLVTQLAIWRFTNGYTVKQSWWASHRELKKLYDYMVQQAQANTTLPDYAVSISPSAKQGYAGEKIGPFTVSATGNGSSILRLTNAPSGVTLVDENGNNVDGASIRGTKTVYVSVPANQRPGSATFSLSGQGELPAGTFLASNGSVQPIGTVTPGGVVKQTVNAVATWTDKPESSTPETTPSEPSTEVTTETTTKTVTVTPEPSTKTVTPEPSTTTVTEPTTATSVVTVTETPEPSTETVTPEPTTKTVTETAPPTTATTTVTEPSTEVTTTTVTKPETTTVVTGTPVTETKTVTATPETTTVVVPPETSTVTETPDTSTVVTTPPTATETETQPPATTTVTVTPVTTTVIVPPATTTVTETPTTVTETATPTTVTETATPTETTPTVTTETTPTVTTSTTPTVTETTTPTVTETTSVPAPTPLEIGTVALDKADNDKIVAPGGTIVDNVTLKGLTKGDNYTVVGQLMDKETGKSIDVQAARTFIATDSNMTVQVTFDLPANIQGKKLVVFEKLYAGTNVNAQPIASHEDINDEAQTVTVEEVEDKGENPGGSSGAIGSTDNNGGNNNGGSAGAITSGSSGNANGEGNGNGGSLGAITSGSSGNANGNGNGEGNGEGNGNGGSLGAVTSGSSGNANGNGNGEGNGEGNGAGGSLAAVTSGSSGNANGNAEGEGNGAGGSLGAMTSGSTGNANGNAEGEGNGAGGSLGAMTSGSSGNAQGEGNGAAGSLASLTGGGSSWMWLALIPVIAVLGIGGFAAASASGHFGINVFASSFLRGFGMVR